MESLGLNAVAAGKSAGVHRLLWFSSFGAKPDNQARFSRRHPVIDEAAGASGIPYTILRPNFHMKDFSAFYGDYPDNRQYFSAAWRCAGQPPRSA
jgi:uncharacterized protein YbjT (DUF2867 family)